MRVDLFLQGGVTYHVQGALTPCVVNLRRLPHPLHGVAYRVYGEKNECRSAIHLLAEGRRSLEPAVACLK